MTARQPFCHPFRHKDDERLNWLEHTFLVYLDGWEKNVYNREGFTLSEKKRMLLSTETLQGIRRTVKAFIEFIKYLFSLPEVTDNRLAFLSNNICQDPLENYFGCQRQRGGTNDNTTVHQFVNNTQALRVVNSFCRAPVRSNCRSGVHSKMTEADLAPLIKRPRK
jgi:hypothetical protein